MNSTGLAVFIEILIMFLTGLGYMVNTKFSNELAPKVAPSTTDSLWFGETLLYVSITPEGHLIITWSIVVAWPIPNVHLMYSCI